MAKCALAIQLDEPNRVYFPGERVRGSLIVNADADVNCKALNVSSGWATHGRGNVDSFNAQSEVLFQGQWRSGEEYRYAFDLPVASWPPTYHGTYLNVDHYINANADIPWAFDPKTVQPFRVHCVDAPNAGAAIQLPSTNSLNNKIATGTLIFVAIFMLLNPMLWIIAVPLAFIAGGWWFFKNYLPKKLLGQVEYKLDRDHWHPGDTLSATLSVHPSKDIAIDGIIWTVTGEEVCVSGSGSNRRTHRHELFGGGKVLSDIKRLPGNQETRILLELPLPDSSFYTMDLGDNKVQWHTHVRIDIPRWPDWIGKQGLQLVPATEPAEMAAVSESHIESTRYADTHAVPAVTESDSLDVTFEATLQMIQSVDGDRDQIDRIVDAVLELPMQITIIPQRRELYGSASSQFAYRDGHVVIGQTVDPCLPVTMFIPRSLADEFEQASDKQWTGPASIVGYDHRQKRLQLRIEAEQDLA